MLFLFIELRFFFWSLRIQSTNMITRLFKSIEKHTSKKINMRVDIP